MCNQCADRSIREVLALFRRCIWSQGWAVADVGPTRGRAAYSYTIGLTRHRGHPELLASGLVPGEARGLLSELADEGRAGRRFGAGEVLSPDGGHLLQLVRVADPGSLTHAQAIYGSTGIPVPALQVVWSDGEGHWPWQRGWPGRVSDQPLFGLPLHH